MNPRRRPIKAASWTGSPLGTVGVLAAIVIPVLSVARLTVTSGFVADDFINFHAARESGLTLEYLGRPVFGHFAPGRRLAEWMVERFLPFDYSVDRIVLLVCFGASLFLLYRVLRELFGTGPGPKIVTFMYGVSVVHVGTIQWWASGLDIIPATALGFAAVLAYLRFRQSRSWLLLGLSVAAVGLGELFYVKVIFVPVYLVLIRLLVLEPERPLSEIAADLVREWRVWLAYAAVVLAFVAVYVPNYPSELNPNPTLDTIADYLGILWFKAFVPSLAGLWTPLFKSDTSRWIAIFISQVVLVALVAWSIARWRSTWRVWTFFAAMFMLNAITVGATRIGVFPADVIAYQHRYNVEAYFLMSIVACAVIGRRSASALRIPGLSILGILLVGYSTASWWAGNEIGRPAVWVGASSRAYLDEATSEVRGLQRSGRRIALVDRPGPDVVLPSLGTPQFGTSYVMPLADDKVSLDPTGRELFDLDPTGRAAPVDFVAETGGDAVSLDRARSLEVVGATPTSSEGGVCLTSGDNVVGFRFRPPAAMAGPNLAARIDFRSTKQVLLSVVVEADPRPGSVADKPKDHLVEVDSDHRQTRVFGLEASTLDRFALVVAPHSSICLYRVEVGHLTPRAELASKG